MKLGIILSLSLMLMACKTTPVQEINERFREVLEQRQNQYQIKAGDTIALRFYNQDAELNQTVHVLPDGRTDPYFMDDVVVAGLTVRELQDEVQRYYVQQINSPEVSVDIMPAGETVIVEGEVGRPAVQAYSMNMTLMQAIGNAQGYKLTACLHTIVVRRSYLDPKHPDVYKVNLREYYGVPEELFLLPNDHIIVEKNWAILVRDYIDAYVWGFLPPFLRSSPFSLLAAAGI